MATIQIGNNVKIGENKESNRSKKLKKKEKTNIETGNNAKPGENRESTGTRSWTRKKRENRGYHLTNLIEKLIVEHVAGELHLNSLLVRKYTLTGRYTAEKCRGSSGLTKSDGCWNSLEKKTKERRKKRIRVSCVCWNERENKKKIGRNPRISPKNQQRVKVGIHRENSSLDQASVIEKEVRARPINSLSARVRRRWSISYKRKSKEFFSKKGERTRSSSFWFGKGSPKIEYQLQKKMKRVFRPRESKNKEIKFLIQQGLPEIEYQVSFSNNN